MSGIKYSKRADAAKFAELMEPSMRRVEKAMTRRARLGVPKKTRALQHSIKGETRRSGSQIVVTIGAGGGKVSYALYVERGTGHTSAQPYLRPALLQTTGADFG